MGGDKSERRRKPARHDLSDWIVTDDWPERIPVTQAEVAVFEALFGDLFDELCPDTTWGLLRPTVCEPTGDEEYLAPSISRKGAIR